MNAIIRLSPYSKAIVALAGSVVATVVSVLVDGNLGWDEVGVLSAGIGTAWGVFQKRNGPNLNESGSTY